MMTLDIWQPKSKFGKYLGNLDLLPTQGYIDSSLALIVKPF